MVITTRFKENPMVWCTVEGCSMSRPEYRTRTRARAHVIDTGHEVKVSIEDITIYRKGQ